jgi:hypothetical protein
MQIYYNCLLGQRKQKIKLNIKVINNKITAFNSEITLST